MPIPTSMPALRSMLKNKEFRFRLIAAVMVKFLIGLTILAIVVNNHEFLYYDAIILPLMVAAFLLHKQIHLSATLFLFICILFVLHAAGGALSVNGVRLYDVPVGPLHFDNIVHVFGSIVAALVGYNLIHRHLSRWWRGAAIPTFVLVLCIAVGMGALVEIVEFSAVVFLNARGVGDYHNNALDLVMNMIGASIGSLMVVGYQKKAAIKKI